MATMTPRFYPILTNGIQRLRFGGICRAAPICRGTRASSGGPAPAPNEAGQNARLPLKISQISKRQGSDVTWNHYTPDPEGKKWTLVGSEVVALDGPDPKAGSSGQGTTLIARTKRRVVDYLVIGFLPKNYPESVSKGYLDFTLWNMLANVTGTLCNVLSLQALLQAVGMGAGSTPMAAGINWVLKDGAGQLGGVIYASMVSSKFDARPKHHRFTSALLLHAATLLELVTPLFPQFFVASASISNIAKNVSWLATGATRAAINRTFAVHDNLGDLTAKSGAQSTAAGLIGTALGVVLSYMMPSAHPMALVAAFLPMAAINTYAVHASCRSVVTATLDPQRADLALHSLARALSVGSSDVVPELHGPAQVSERESFVKVPKNGSILLEPPLDMPGLSGFSMGKGHLLAISSKNQPALWFAEQASGRDCVLGYLRALVCSELLKNSASAEEALAKSSDAVEIHGSHVVEGLVKAGWDLDNHFLAEAGRRIRVSA